MAKPSPIPKVFRYLPPIITVLLIVLSVLAAKQMSLMGLISYTPQNYLLAFSGLMLLYAVKSLSVIFPLSALYIVSAFWFGPWWAIVINYLGLIVCDSIPFFIGRYFGTSAVDHLVQKYPKLRQFQQLGISNEIMLSYILRIVSVLPGDLCSLFLGACSVNYRRYLLGSLLGLSPMMILHVLFADILVESASGSLLSALTPGNIILIILLLGASILSSVLLNKKYSSKEK